MGIGAQLVWSDFLQDVYHIAHPSFLQRNHHNLIGLGDVDIGDDVLQARNVIRMIGQYDDIGLAHAANMTVLRDQWSENFQQVFGFYVLYRDDFRYQLFRSRIQRIVLCPRGLLARGALLNANHVARGYCGIVLQP